MKTGEARDLIWAWDPMSWGDNRSDLETEYDSLLFDASAGLSEGLEVEEVAKSIASAIAREWNGFEGAEAGRVEAQVMPEAIDFVASLQRLVEQAARDNS
jgi:hypothetical protein